MQAPHALARDDSRTDLVTEKPPGTISMEMKTARHGNVLSVEVVGRIDGSNAIEFEEAIRTLAAGRDRAMILDCSGLCYLSSAGLRAVLMSAKSLSNLDVRFALCDVSDHVLEVFKKSGFDQIISIHPSKAEALLQLGAR